MCDIEKIQDARIEIAITLRQDNKLDDALIILKSIIPISVSHNLVNIEGKALVQQGLCLFSQANTNEQDNLYLVAYKLYQKGLVCAEKAGDLKQIIYTKITMSTVMEKLNKLNEACDLLHESQLLATEHNFHHLYIDCFNGLARKYLILKNYEKCIFFAEKGLKMWEKNNFFRGQLVMCCHLLEAHFFLESSSKDVLVILKKGTLLDGIVTEKLIKHMYKKASQLWLHTINNT